MCSSLDFEVWNCVIDFCCHPNRQRIELKNDFITQKILTFSHKKRSSALLSYFVCVFVCMRALWCHLFLIVCCGKRKNALNASCTLSKIECDMRRWKENSSARQIQFKCTHGHRNRKQPAAPILSQITVPTSDIILIDKNGIRNALAHCLSHLMIERHWIQLKKG